MAEPVRRSPLAGFADPDRIVAGAEPVTLSALPFTGKLLLRGDAEVRDRASAVLGCELPGTMRSASGGAVRALWLGPDEWLLLTAPDAVDGSAAALRGELAALHHAVIEVSDRFTGIGIAGARAADTLNAGCPLDLHPSVFPAAMVTRTLLAKAPVVLHRQERADAFELHVNGSFAPYAWLFLENAAREFGFTVAA
jgi:sarcosine oxidase subunit gamma